MRDRKTGAIKREGLVKPEMMQEWLTRSGVVLKGGGLDESPHCYKRLNEVLRVQSETIRILHTLTTLGVAMAGADEFDPYKDDFALSPDGLLFLQPIRMDRSGA